MDIHQEKHLITQLRQGSQKAFDALYRLYSPRLFAYSVQYVKSFEEAEEIVHDVFLALWLHREKLRDVATISPLLLQMSKRRLINALRSKVHSPVFEAYVEHCDGRRSELQLPLEYQEFLAMVQRSMQKLPPQQKLIVEMAKFEGMSPADIAAKLHLNVQTVRNQLSLALKRLRTMLTALLTLIMLLFIKL
ncbi:MAG: RNA polymerase sigma-70 factor [Prevotellaceae bacterium]|nr:RNA polymerase sigma-70 factor [Prevotellaceae bacterium]